MEDRNKDLPLIVSEILIEMQQIRQEMQQDRNENSRLMLLLMDENRKNTEQLLQVFNRGFDMLHTRIDQVDERLERVERKHIHVEGIDTFEVYRKHGGYRSVEKALKTMTPEVVEEVKKSGPRNQVHRPALPWEETGLPNALERN